MDLMVFKRDVLRYLINDFLDERPAFTADQKKLLRDVCSSIKEFRDRCGYFFNRDVRKAAFLFTDFDLYVY